ncbi:MAG: alpha/beta fold hydrolase [Gemmatimonadota bacterium]
MTAPHPRNPLYRNDARIRALRATFRTVGTVAPGLAARLAEALFVRPPRSERREREQEFLASGLRRTVRAGPHELAVWRWGEGPQVICLHGWGSCAGRFSAIGPALVEAGFGVTAFDAPAHGGSTGWRASLPEFAHALEMVAAATGPVHGLVGHSLGGAAIALALSHGLAAERAVLIAPPADISAFSLRFARHLGIPERTRALMQQNLEARFNLRWDHLHVARLARQVRVPALVIHDVDDVDVPWSEGRAVAEAWPGARLVQTQGLGHRAILRDPEVVLRTVEFLAGS